MEKTTAQQLEEKRKKLEELRKLKETRAAISSDVASRVPIAAFVPPPSATGVAVERADIAPAAITATALQVATVVPAATVVPSKDAAGKAHIGTLVEQLLGDESAAVSLEQHQRALASLSTEHSVMHISLDSTKLLSSNKTIDASVQASTEEALPVSPPGAVGEEDLTILIGSDGFGAFLQDAITAVEREMGPIAQSTGNNVLGGSKKFGGAGAQWSLELASAPPIERPISAADWSPHNANMLLCAYAELESLASTQPGLVHVWNLAFPRRPQYTLLAASPVTAARFSPFNANLVIGGCFDGSLVIWDMRMQSEPIERSVCTENAHIQPITAILFSEQRAPDTFYSLSSDGKLCHYGTKLDEPLASVPLGISRRISDKASKISYSSSAVFSPWNPSALFVGGAEGGLYVCEFTGRTSEATSRVAAHHGLISALSHHPSHEVSLVLTASYDFCIKLWDLDTADPYMLECFECATSFITDVEWSPSHPTCFAAADADGFVHLFNLLKDRSDPILSLQAAEGIGITRIKWSHDGKFIAVADTAGKLRIVEVGTDCSSPPPQVSVADVHRVYQRQDPWKSFLEQEQNARRQVAPT